MTFPATAGPDVHGAKALYLVLDWTNFEHGGFTISHLFSPSSTDTLFCYYDGANWSPIDTISISDTIGALTTATAATTGPIPHDAVRSVVIRITDFPGAGYYFCKITPWGAAHANWITGLNATLVVVQ
jgi:hypothetical protein